MVSFHYPRGIPAPGNYWGATCESLVQDGFSTFRSTRHSPPSRIRLGPTPPTPQLPQLTPLPALPPSHPRPSGCRGLAPGDRSAGGTAPLLRRGRGRFQPDRMAVHLPGGVWDSRVCPGTHGHLHGPRRQRGDDSRRHRDKPCVGLRGHERQLDIRSRDGPAPDESPARRSPCPSPRVPPRSHRTRPTRSS